MPFSRRFSSATRLRANRATPAPEPAPTLPFSVPYTTLWGQSRRLKQPNKRQSLRFSGALSSQVSKRTQAGNSSKAALAQLITAQMGTPSSRAAHQRAGGLLAQVVGLTLACDRAFKRRLIRRCRFSLTREVNGDQETVRAVVRELVTLSFKLFVLALPHPEAVVGLSGPILQVVDHNFVAG